MSGALDYRLVDIERDSNQALCARVQRIRDRRTIGCVVHDGVKLVSFTKANCTQASWNRFFLDITIDYPSFQSWLQYALDNAR